MLQLKILSATTKTNQINKQKWLRSIVVWGLPWWFGGKEAAHSSRVVQSLSCVWLLRPRGLQHARLPFPSPSSGVYTNSCPLSQWCYPTISSSVAPFSSQSFPESESFPTSQLFKSGGQNTETSASISVLSMNIQGWFPSGLTGLDWSPCCPRDSQESPPASQFESTSSSVLSLLYGPEGMATHSSILAWRIPWTEETDGLQSMGLQKVGHNTTEQLSTFFFKENKVLLIEAHQYTDTC